MNERAAANEELECREKLLAAERERRELSAQQGTVLRYLQLEDWLETLGIKHGHAAQRLRLARAETERSKSRVRQAQVSLKQVEVLAARIALQEADVRKRRERTLEDEISQQLLSFRKGK